ncbi:LysR family transcriptional regulator [Cupriavidus basilensis OR16]|uniref:LysR family transcriptional regulator n=1 Tax=Cupriavidus basilensis OR16 TaxID=1127483 RepID=H1SGE5_9BURK|nr:LysR family transcriptional regulator [Cupriavidus basilensis]EHP38483.1 LysR family transcriptional regulator [Cupriavidus basilensis OR16]
MQPIRFDLGDLQAMVAVVEQGGFRAAAESLSLSQPALSRRIDKLEQALNVRLFERTTRMVDEGANVVLHSVASGEADFGLNFIGTQEADLLFEPLLRDPFVLACRHDHPLARRRSVKWAELGAHTLVALAKSSGNRLMLDLALAEVPLRPAAFYEVRHVSSVLALVEAGLGVAAVPRLALPDGDRAALVAVCLREPAVSRTLGILRRPGRALSPHAQAFYEMVGQAVPRRGRPAGAPAGSIGSGAGIDA